MIEQIGGDTGNFGRNIDRFIEMGFVAPHQHALFRGALIEAGHAAMHRGYKPTEAHLSALLDMTEALIAAIYVHPQRVAEAAGLPVRHIEQGSNVPMYRTSIATTPAGRFSGPLVVTMRPLAPSDAIRAVQVTGRFPSVHGAPVHLGDPAAIGIRDVMAPDYGDPVEIRPGEIPVFWACGVTPQAVIAKTRPGFCITHAPCYMLVTDIRNGTLATG